MSWIPERFSRKEKIGLLLALVVLSAAVLDRLVVSPLYAMFRDLNREIKIAEIELGRDLRNVGQKEAIADEYENYIKYVQRTGSNEEEIAKMLDVIEGLAQKSAVALMEIRPQRVDAEREPIKYSVDIEARGEMVSIMNFLYGLNTSAQLLRPERVEIRRPDSDSSVCRVSIRVTRMVIPS